MLALILSLALSTTVAEPEQPTTTTTAKPEKAKKVCRADNTTGSRLKTRICKTQEEWDAMNAAMRQDAQSKAGGQSGNGG